MSCERLPPSPSCRALERETAARSRWKCPKSNSILFISPRPSLKWPGPGELLGRPLVSVAGIGWLDPLAPSSRQVPG